MKFCSFGWCIADMFLSKLLIGEAESDILAKAKSRCPSLIYVMPARGGAALLVVLLCSALVGGAIGSGIGSTYGWIGALIGAQLGAAVGALIAAAVALVRR